MRKQRGILEGVCWVARGVLRESVFAVAGLTALASMASATQIYTFAGFQEQGTGGDVFGFVNYVAPGSATNANGSFSYDTNSDPCGYGVTCHVFTTLSSVSATTNGGTTPLEPSSSTTPGSIPVVFDYQEVAGSLPAALQGNISASMDIQLFATTGAHSTMITPNDYFTYQPFTSGTITITANAPITSGFPGCTPTSPCSNLLTVNINSLTEGLNGQRGGTTAALNGDVGSLGDSFTFTSDFLQFNGQLFDQLAMSFTSVTPCFTRDDTASNTCTTGVITNGSVGNFLRTFVGAGSGTFAASPEPYANVPEPLSTSLVGAALVSLAVLAGRLRRKA